MNKTRKPYPIEPNTKWMTRCGGIDIRNFPHERSVGRQYNYILVI